MVAFHLTATVLQNSKTMKKQTGIWLDFREANLIELAGGEANVVTIASEIDPSRPKGGSGSRGTPYGPMDKISESKYLERRKHQEQAYYQKLVAALKGADELYIFGPAQAKDGLLKTIKDTPNFRPHLSGFDTADSMTENQKVAKVKAFFGGG